jgi:hypothetical protein
VFRCFGASVLRCYWTNLGQMSFARRVSHLLGLTLESESRKSTESESPSTSTES